MATKPASKPAAAKKRRVSMLNLIKNDPWLEPFTGAIEGRHNDVVRKEAELVGPKGSLNEFANAHNYFGLHRTADGGWVFREWAPNASSITLIGDFSDWKRMARYELRRLDDFGVWELTLPADALKHGQYYKMLVAWPGGEGGRLPA